MKKTAENTDFQSDSILISSEELIQNQNDINIDTYMRNKKAKLQISNNQIHPQDIVSNIFQKCSIFVNGYTNPPVDDIRYLTITNGGNFETYRSSNTTHIICNNFTDGQIKNLSTRHNNRISIFYVTDKWVVDSLKAKQKLLEIDYLPNDLKSHFPTNVMKYFTVNATNITNSADKVNLLSSSIDKTSSISSNISNLENNSENNPNFLNDYFQSSRLHFIGMWKSKLPQLHKKLAQKYNKNFNNNPNTFELNKNPIENQRIIVHIDMDCFFVSALIRNEHNLYHNKSVVVAHGNSDNTEISCCNYTARSKGIKNGMYMKNAKKLCDNIIVLSYNFILYEQISLEFYELLYSLNENMNIIMIEAVSIDELYIKFSYNDSITNIDSMISEIRKLIFDKTLCTVSAGIGSNKLLARLATKKAKPNGQYKLFLQSNDLDNNNIKEYMRLIELKELPGIGSSMTDKLNTKKLLLCEDLWNISLETLKEWFGELNGINLYHNSRGVDYSLLESPQPRKSIGKFFFNY